MIEENVLCNLDVYGSRPEAMKPVITVRLANELLSEWWSGNRGSNDSSKFELPGDELVTIEEVVNDFKLYFHPSSDVDFSWVKPLNPDERLSLTDYLLTFYLYDVYSRLFPDQLLAGLEITLNWGK